METKTKRNCRVQKLYDMLMGEGKHGHYEAMFHIVRIEVEVEREACAMVCDKVSDEAWKRWKERYHPHDEGSSDGAAACATDIRSRSPNQPI